ncbi:MAG: TetR/AcrR family transcriptional regulator [Hyphomonas sp.]|nr:TetR/AcrR family transcriptional regulator [Hyphomonas sp.]
MSTATKKSPWPELEAGTEDGRRRRSDRSRRRIIEAMFDLISEGHMSPSAVDVAERAGVGLRTVFRHFEDMDSIYDEMTAELTEAVMPKFMAPYEAASWREHLMECVDRRADIYETVFPMRVCMMLRRFHSKFLGEQYERETKLARSALKSILPKQVTANRELFGAIEALLDFSTWRQLRQDQNRSVESAKASLRLALNGLIADVDAD